MKFRNVKNGAVKEVTGYTKIFAYSHNSLWQPVREKATSEDSSVVAKVSKEQTVAEIKATLDELKIPYASNATKQELLAILPHKG